MYIHIGPAAYEAKKYNTRFFIRRLKDTFPQSTNIEDPEFRASVHSITMWKPVSYRTVISLFRKTSPVFVSGFYEGNKMVVRSTSFYSYAEARRKLHKNLAAEWDLFAGRFEYREEKI